MKGEVDGAGLSDRCGAESDDLQSEAGILGGGVGGILPAIHAPMDIGRARQGDDRRTGICRRRDRGKGADVQCVPRPERHLGDKGELLPGPMETNQEGHASFGFGRRICVGKYLAIDSLFIHTARILWATTIECVQDENGNDMLPDTNAFIGGSIMQVIMPVHQLRTSLTFLCIAALRHTTVELRPAPLK